MTPTLPDWLDGRLTITVPQAGELLGIGRDAAYRAAATGDIQCLSLGRRLVVPVAPLLALLGFDITQRAPIWPADPDDAPPAA
ncbi:helix-turn-helix domain-containing protein [Allobranchiibius sp. GilTou38]|uniref:helix-turn-helix domain-containing protein n=1 Tax=Allobranchiibius sp. GilTou38 TaxID=2815210 RepID=UPI001AA0E58F|nr:helix-turn-helix domain-containing protein [Allobranchiibius sp. GilTou38]MBO1767053.1 helix-turn-helix domain-containing protein [Allobranchiibius sp. GilTou38]